jgi:hypothetical protein
VLAILVPVLLGTTSPRHSFPRERPRASKRPSR